MSQRSMAVERPFDYHTMTQLARQRAADAAHATLDGLQNLTPEEIVLGVAVLFAAVTRRSGLDPEDLYQMGLRVLKPEPLHRRANDSLQSLTDFVALRVKGERDVSIS